MKQSPEYYKILLDNDQVRVLEYRLEPGQSEPMHSHPAGMVYFFSDAKFRTTYTDGTVTEGIVGSGSTTWRDATTHAAVNIGYTGAHGLAVELKNSCKQ